MVKQHRQCQRKTGSAFYSKSVKHVQGVPKVVIQYVVCSIPTLAHPVFECADKVS